MLYPNKTENNKMTIIYLEVSGDNWLSQTFRSGDNRLSPDQKVCWQPAVFFSNNPV